MTAVRGAEVFAWRSFGDALLIGSMPDGAWHVTVETDDGRATVTLPTGSVAALGDSLELHDGCVPYEQHADEIGALEQERDEALESLRLHRDEVTRLLAELETLRTALDLADQRSRGLERDIERMRSAAHALDYRGCTS